MKILGFVPKVYKKTYRIVKKFDTVKNYDLIVCMYSCNERTCKE